MASHQETEVETMERRTHLKREMAFEGLKQERKS
jgi:hypothetical protein